MTRTDHGVPAGAVTCEFCHARVTKWLPGHDERLGWGVFVSLSSSGEPPAGTVYLEGRTEVPRGADSRTARGVTTAAGGRELVPPGAGSRSLRAAPSIFTVEVVRPNNRRLLHVGLAARDPLSAREEGGISSSEVLS
jgi:hypothetical protein